jgi:GDPmannose 4,6-dehydratase
VGKEGSGSYVAIFAGAAGQDGYFFTGRLLDEGWTVHAGVRRPEVTRALAQLRKADGRLKVHAVDHLEPSKLLNLVASVQPEEYYNLAGYSSVSSSFSDSLNTWRTNADAVALLLEYIRTYSPYTRFYQASSSEVFGHVLGGSVLHDEDSVIKPQSPYGSAKAAAHLLRRSYREAYGSRVSCGILSNDASRRRPAWYLSWKVVNHVLTLRRLPPAALREHPPLAMGNLKVKRDWGFAPAYVEGIRSIVCQIRVRSSHLGTQPDPGEGTYYRDYVPGTGREGCTPSGSS